MRDSVYTSNLARVIPAFVTYCVNGASHSSLLIESTDSMIDRPGRLLVRLSFGLESGL